jgi:hypothetical protein
VVADAPPVMVWVAIRTCLRSITVESLPPTAIVGAITTPPIDSVNVPADADVFATMIDVTTVDVEDGVVYSTVAVLVVAAPRNKVLLVVGII